MSVALFERYTFNQARCQIEEQIDDKTNKKKLFMSGIFIQGGVRNLNERVYPVSEISNAVESLRKQIDENIYPLGEADHPEELNINLDRVSHMITQMWMDGANGMGKLQIVETPMGHIVRTLIESGAKLGVSSRGSGNVDDRGNVSEFEIITVDIVAKPSAPNAFPKAIHETRNSKRGAIITDLAESVVYDLKAQKYLKKELLEWINNLR